MSQSKAYNNLWRLSKIFASSELVVPHITETSVQPHHEEAEDGSFCPLLFVSVYARGNVHEVACEYAASAVRHVIAHVFSTRRRVPPPCAFPSLSQNRLSMFTLSN